MNPSPRIKIICRIRPALDFEFKEGKAKQCVFDEPDGTSVSVVTDDGTHKFRFDRVFGQSSNQAEVYEASVCPVINEVLKGYNGTVFAYGQTSAGKTYTMVGHEGSREGMIQRALRQLFNTLSSSPDTWTVTISFLEIYMEKVYDLLVSDATRPAQLSVYEDQGGSVRIPGATCVGVSTLPEALDLLSHGLARRAVGAHRMNRTSSRSHAILRLQLQQTLREGQGDAAGRTALATFRTSTLNLVDLAGSEKVTRTEVCDMRLREAKKINQSLLALGTVVNILSAGEKTGEKSVLSTPSSATAQSYPSTPSVPGRNHIPYRDSKLTRILSDSLGGNHLTTIIFNLSPCLANVSEILNTLYFSRRAKCIKNRVWINERMMFDDKESEADLEVMLGNCKLKLSEQELLIERMNNKLRECEGQGGVKGINQSFDGLQMGKLGGDARGMVNGVSIDYDDQQIPLAMKNYISSFTQQKRTLKAEHKAQVITRQNREREIDCEIADCLSAERIDLDDFGIFGLFEEESESEPIEEDIHHTGGSDKPKSGELGHRDGPLGDELWTRFYFQTYEEVKQTETHFKVRRAKYNDALVLLDFLQACSVFDIITATKIVKIIVSGQLAEGGNKLKNIIFPFLGYLGDYGNVAAMIDSGADVKSTINFDAIVEFIRDNAPESTTDIPPRPSEIRNAKKSKGLLSETQDLLVFYRNRGLVNGDSCIHTTCRLILNSSSTGGGTVNARNNAIIRLVAKCGVLMDAANSLGETPIMILLSTNTGAAALQTFELLLRCGVTHHRPISYIQSPQSQMPSDPFANPLISAQQILASSNVEVAPTRLRKNSVSKNTKILNAVVNSLDGADSEAMAWFCLLLDCCRLHMGEMVQSLMQHPPRARIKAVFTDLGIYDDMFEHKSEAQGTLNQDNTTPDYDKLYSSLYSLLSSNELNTEIVKEKEANLCSRPTYSFLAHILVEASPREQTFILRGLDAISGRLCKRGEGELFRSLCPHISYPFTHLINCNQNDKALDLLLSDSAILLANACGEIPAVMWLKSSPNQRQSGAACMRLLLGTEYGKLFVVSLLLGGLLQNSFMADLASPRVSQRGAKTVLKVLSDSAKLRDIALLLKRFPIGDPGTYDIPQLNAGCCCLELAALHANVDNGAKYQLLLDFMQDIQTRMSAGEGSVFREVYSYAKFISEQIII